MGGEEPTLSIQRGVPGARDPRLTPYMIPWAGRSLPAAGNIAEPSWSAAPKWARRTKLFNMIGERLDTRPAPIMYVGPSRDFNTDQFEPRLMALFDQAPSLAGSWRGPAQQEDEEAHQWRSDSWRMPAPRPRSSRIRPRSRWLMNMTRCSST